MLYARVEQKGVVGVVVYILLAVTSCYLVPRYCEMKQPGPDITRTLTRDWFHFCEHSLLKGDWRVSVSLTLVEPVSMKRFLFERSKSNHYTTLWFCVNKNRFF